MCAMAISSCLHIVFLDVLLMETLYLFVGVCWLMLIHLVEVAVWGAFYLWQGLQPTARNGNNQDEHKQRPQAELKPPPQDPRGDKPKRD